MMRTLHILRTAPDEMVGTLIEAMATDKWTTVVSLYRDEMSNQPVDWYRLVDDIFSHEKIICWW
jgi:hypothetical protein